MQWGKKGEGNIASRYFLLSPRNSIINKSGKKYVLTILSVIILVIYSDKETAINTDIWENNKNNSRAGLTH